jgi:hypothetical protein
LATNLGLAVLKHITLAMENLGRLEAETKQAVALSPDIDDPITNPMMGVKAFHSAKATIDGSETAHMIRKGQLSGKNIPAYKQFMALAG